MWNIKHGVPRRRRGVGGILSREDRRVVPLRSGGSWPGGGVKHVFGMLPYGQHANTRVEVVGSLASEVSAKLEGLSGTYGFRLTRWQGPESSPDASRWIERHLVYMQKAAEFEQALARYLAGRQDVNEQVRVLVDAGGLQRVPPATSSARGSAPPTRRSPGWWAPTSRPCSGWSTRGTCASG